MTEEIDDLVRMANQIGRNFVGCGDDESVNAVRNHLRMFWTPGMRRALTVVSMDRRDDLLPVVVRALESLKWTDR